MKCISVQNLAPEHLRYWQQNICERAYQQAWNSGVQLARVAIYKTGVGKLRNALQFYPFQRPSP